MCLPFDDLLAAEKRIALENYQILPTNSRLGFIEKSKNFSIKSRFRKTINDRFIHTIDILSFEDLENYSNTYWDIIEKRGQRLEYSKNFYYNINSVKVKLCNPNKSISQSKPVSKLNPEEKEKLILEMKLEFYSYIYELLNIKQRISPRSYFRVTEDKVEYAIIQYWAKYDAVGFAKALGLFYETTYTPEK